MRITRPKLNYANVIATIALFVALGGAAVAAGLPKNSVGQKQLKRGAVTAAKLKRGAVTSGKIAPRAVTAGKLGANAVLPGNLGNGIITTNKLSDGAVIASKIKNGVITTNKLDNGAVITSKLGNDAVTTAKLGDKSVTLGKLADNLAPLLGTLKSGQTLRGVFAIGGDPKISLGSQSFQFPLVNPPAAPDANIQEAGKTTTACTGISGTATPQATAGQLCVYITAKSPKFENLTFDPAATNRLGFGLVASFTEPDSANAVSGQWAVTAP